MLTITVPASELYDEKNGIFIQTKEQTLKLEHSLVAISKWESKWHKAYLEDNEKTDEEIIDYIKCMTITQNVDPNVYLSLTTNNVKDIVDYINDRHSASYLPEDKTRKSLNRDKVTSELIYYWMVALQIPFECEKWHINRLLNLIQITNIKNQPDKKMSKNDIMRRNRALNEARKQKFRTKG